MRKSPAWVRDERTTRGTSVGGVLDHVGKLTDAEDEDSNEEYGGTNEREWQEESSGSVDEGADNRANHETNAERGLAPSTGSRLSVRKYCRENGQI